MGQALAILYLLVFLAGSAWGQVVVEQPCSRDRLVADEYLVRVSAASFSSAYQKGLQNPQWLVKSLSPNSSIFASHLGQKVSILTAAFLARVKNSTELAQIQDDPNVLSIEANCRVSLMATTPNDPDLTKSWALDFIKAPVAWDILQSSSVIVAVPDTGVEIVHPELVGNIWLNVAEANGLVGVDDDGNGYVDDINGWAFAEKTPDVTPGSYVGADHGTHIAGIIGATGNNGLGISGVSWHSKLMALRPFSKNSESATTADLVESIYYAVNNGAKIINCSWGSQQAPSKAEIDAYAYAEAHDVLVVAAAGNDHADVALYSPAAISTVFSVGSINSQKALSTFSNYGLGLGILAPGGDAINSFGEGLDEGIFSLSLNGSFATKKGTSFSAPFVTGVASLVRTIAPQISAGEVRRLLQVAGDQVTLRAGGATRSYSILNAGRAVSIANELTLYQPSCRENCVLSDSSTQSSLAPVSSSNFGGGGCALRAPTLGDQVRGASSGWDIALIISFFFPLGRLLRPRAKMKKPSSFESRL